MLSSFLGSCAANCANYAHYLNFIEDCESYGNVSFSGVTRQYTQPFRVTICESAREGKFTLIETNTKNNTNLTLNATAYFTDIQGWLATRGQHCHEISKKEDGFWKLTVFDKHLDEVIFEQNLVFPVARHYSSSKQIAERIRLRSSVKSLALFTSPLS